MHEMQGT